MEDYKYIVKKRGLKSKKERKKFFKTFIFFFLIFSFVVLGGYCYTYIQKHIKVNSPFYIKKIEVIDAKNVNIKKLNKALNKFKGKSLTSLAFEDVYLKLKDFEWIKDVTIHKSYPSTLIVEINEVKPVGILDCNSKFFLIGDNGVLIKHFKKEYLNKGLYIFPVKSLALYSIYKNKILTICKKLENSNIKNISEIIIGKDIIMITYSPYRKYILSFENFENNLAKIELINKYNKILSFNKSKLKEINLKYSDKIYIKL